MLSRKQVQARITHPSWPEYLDDISTHYSELLQIYDLVHWTNVKTILKRIDDMEKRFRKTFYPEMADAENSC